MKLLTVLLAGATLFAADRQTVYVDKMNGLESYVEDALKRQELPFDFVEEVRFPDLKTQLKQRSPKTYAEILYHKQTGRTDIYTLELLDLRTNKIVAHTEFKMPYDEDSKKSVARDFAAAVRKAIK
jgi:hypothetical protein